MCSRKGTGGSNPSLSANQSRIGRILRPLVQDYVAALGYAFFTEIATAALVYLPRSLPHLQQKVGYCTTSEGVQIAYATVGKGPPVVIVVGWLRDIENGSASPTYSGPFLKLVAAHHLAVQYDGRGFGKSDRGVRDYSIDARVRDIEAVVNALGLKKFALYGISVGGSAAIAYTARHPDRVTRLVLQGGTPHLWSSVSRDFLQG